MLNMCYRILKHSYVLEHVSSVYAQSLSQGGWNSGRGAIKKLRAMQVYKKQKIVTICACFCSATMLASKIIP